MREEKIITVKKYNQMEAHFKKHPILSSIFYGFSFVAFGFVFCLFIIGAIIGIPLIIVGLIMMAVGIIGAILSLIIRLSGGKTKKLGLYFPKWMRSKELRRRYG